MDKAKTRRQMDLLLEANPGSPPPNWLEAKRGHTAPADTHQGSPLRRLAEALQGGRQMMTLCTGQFSTRKTGLAARIAYPKKLHLCRTALAGKHLCTRLPVGQDLKAAHRGTLGQLAIQMRCAHRGGCRPAPRHSKTSRTKGTSLGSITEPPAWNLRNCLKIQQWPHLCL